MSNKLKRISSFSVDHTKLEPGIYVSRCDVVKTPIITTFDLRLLRPNIEVPIEQNALHTIEHLGATFLRNSDKKDYVIYFGPMGCRTGFYLVFNDCTNAQEIRELVIKMFEFIRDFKGEIPGATPEECGNYIDHDLALAKTYAIDYLSEITKNCKTEYDYLPSKN
ncbi:S-ribosylhomocysteine lyase [Candidatus Saccharibacteria bacterium]|nr:S-ribosylhomocysteine lyase [Candidatus Saccharibacteria bacterium]